MSCGCFFVLFFSHFHIHLCRVDGVSSSQDGELGSSELFNVLPPSYPDHPVVSSDVYAAAHTQQEEGKLFAHTFQSLDLQLDDMA